MPELHEIAAVVLAAGTARRFGSDKLLSPVTRNGCTMPLAAHALLPWLAVFERVAVVVRPASDALQQRVVAALGGEIGKRIDWVACDEAELGMGRSLTSGVAARSDAAGWLVGLADMPCVPDFVIVRLRSALAEGALLTAPFYRNMRGHPVGFAAGYRDELLALDGDRGARALVERDVAALRRIDTDDAGVLMDIDTPADLMTITTENREHKP